MMSQHNANHKKEFFLFLVLTFAMINFAMMNFANAEQICGMISSQIAPADCPPKVACPAHVSMSYVITTQNKEEVVLATQDEGIFEKIRSLVGQSVCVEGVKNQNSLQVSSIAPAQITPVETDVK